MDMDVPDQSLLDELRLRIVFAANPGATDIDAASEFRHTTDHQLCQLLDLALIVPLSANGRPGPVGSTAGDSLGPHIRAS